VVLTLRARGAAALWAVVRVAGVSGTDDEKTVGTAVVPACGDGFFDVPSGGDRDDGVSSGSRCCLARR